MAVTGAHSLLHLAIAVAEERSREKGGNVRLAYPETAYDLPLWYAWRGEKDLSLDTLLQSLRSMDVSPQEGLEAGFSAGEMAMYAAEALEAMRHLDIQELPEEGFIPDRVLRSLGLSFVDDTIPGCAVLLGGTEDREGLVKIVRDGQSRGMVMVANGPCVRHLREERIGMGWDRMLYPVGEALGTVHALNFAVRAALSFGAIAEGDRERLDAYLLKRPKTFVLHMGGLSNLDAAMAFAALMHHAVIVSDMSLPEVPGALFVHRDHTSMLQKGIESRGIEVKVSPVQIPVPYGPAFEGEVLRRPDTHVEFGGGRSQSFELLLSREEGDVEDGRITVLGPELDQMPKGSNVDLAILVEVYGQQMESDLEAVMERRIHQFLNYGEGIWHAGQRDLNWIRVSDTAVAQGLRLHHLGQILTLKLKEEFGKIVTRIQVTLISDPAAMGGLKDEAVAVYEARDERLAGLTDESVSEFYTCSMCQSFAPDHICIISPERLGLCGAINWLDAKASHGLFSAGPNQPVPKGRTLDADKGEWEGVNSTVHMASHGTVDRMCMYSLMDAPMTSCGCFEVILAMTPDMQSVIAVHREHTGMTPVGMKFSTLAGSIGGGRQTPGFMGVGRKYLTSDKFMAAEGGFLRVSWMPRSLKESLRESLTEIGRRAGIPDLVDKIADETITEDAEGLMDWMTKVSHPALDMDPLI
ncbi:MAG: acetyl-CoA decarbonylase/synthase complex subunit alpha/beta [Candidatus Methanomethylophilaceae archaeon]|nr:acetyl-CoA decarbonylase/synthase complex subunit alpha/beta [Candidatus Methanomethylophilaceae archaeon]